MSGQLELPVGEPPLRFDVRRWDPALTAAQNFAGEGVLLDSFTEDELHTVAWGRPEKALHEAAIWASLATVQDRRARG